LQYKERSKDLEMDYTEDGVNFEKLSERLFKAMS